ncbi:SusD family protein [Parapedobacter luteus]|uniref:SusD family protein n=1 Tax=Parapedobacter luteus TaxID=623280 RepID=A0A1T5CJI4_9SPHI|nr:RagB/SusD family nutrient uptake outer membrane protein [Parapedobacter luteus]SKB59609.1 SusD family protein [Parapedobacter luteus]
MKNSIKISLWSAVSAMLMSCESFVDINPSPQMMESKDVFTTGRTAEAAVDGVYAFMRTSSPSLLNGALSIYCGLAADELQVSSENELYSPFYHNALQSGNSTVSYQLWDVPYQTIYRCNSILEQLDMSASLPAGIKHTLAGEMKLVRALHYMYLANLFGKVPLVLNTDYETNAKLGGSAIDEVRQQVIRDLREASNLLPEAYRGVGKIRPNKWAALALLARAYIYAGEYTDAQVVASAVIDANEYGLVADLQDVFGINSAETIWEIAPPNNTGNTAEAGALLPPGAGAAPAVLPTPSLVAVFDADDRRMRWFSSQEAIGQNEAYINKYRYQTYDATMEYLVVCRLAEQYLIRAESRIQSRDLEGARADINVIRLRAGIDTLTTLDETLLMEALREERRRELIAEWGHRWFDLIRWGMADDVLGAAKPGWKATAALFPIPYEQLLYNPYLTQNAGY